MSLVSTSPFFISPITGTPPVYTEEAPVYQNEVDAADPRITLIEGDVNVTTDVEQNSVDTAP